MSEDPARLRRAVDHLMEAQSDALEATGRALDAEAEDPDEGQGANERLEAALANVRDILEGAQEDAQDILEGGA